MYSVSLIRRVDVVFIFLSIRYNISYLQRKTKFPELTNNSVRICQTEVKTTNVCENRRVE